MQRRPLLAGKSQPPEIWMERGGRCSLRLILSRLWVEIRTHSATAETNNNNNTHFTVLPLGQPMCRDQPNSREKMRNFMVEFLKCAKFHGKFTE